MRKHIWTPEGSLPLRTALESVNSGMSFHWRKDLTTLLSLSEREFYMPPVFEDFVAFVDPFRNELILAPRKGGMPKWVEFISREDGHVISRMIQEKSLSIGTLSNDAKDVAIFEEYMRQTMKALAYAIKLYVDWVDRLFSKSNFFGLGDLVSVPPEMIEIDVGALAELLEKVGDRIEQNLAELLGNVGGRMRVNIEERNAVMETESVWPVINRDVYVFLERSTPTNIVGA